MCDEPDNDTRAGSFFTPTEPAVARVRNFIEGGKDHYRVDRETVREVLEVFPTFPAAARACRDFGSRAVHALAQRGSDQFLVFGAGLDPTVHTDALAVRPASRIFYADDDPVVLAHGRALHGSAPGAGRIGWGSGTLACAPELLDEAQSCGVLDPARAIAVLLSGTTEYVRADAPVVEWVRDLVSAVAPGSALILCQTVTDFAPEVVAMAENIFRDRGVPWTARSRREFEEFFDGVELMFNGIVPPHSWNPNGARVIRADAEVCCLAGVGIKR